MPNTKSRKLNPEKSLEIRYSTPLLTRHKAKNTKNPQHPLTKIQKYAIVEG